MSRSHIGRCSAAKHNRPDGSGDRFGEEHDVLVAEQVQVGVQIVLVVEVNGPQSFPAEQIFGDGERGPGPSGPYAT